MIVKLKRQDFLKRLKIVEKAINIKDRIKAAELLGKRYGLFTEKLQFGGNV